MRNKFDEQLEVLNVELIKMGALCEDAIANVSQAVICDDDSYADAVFPIDAEIDQKERDIEALCLKLLLQQQPVASDLRKISSAMKMISDMERIGDQAADIAEISKFVTGNNTKSEIKIADMAKATIKMVTESVDSFVNKDVELARNVIKYDDVVDNLFSEVKNELISLISENSANGEFCIDLLMIAKYFERIGDHATNIAEWVEYSLTGIRAGGD